MAEWSSKRSLIEKVTGSNRGRCMGIRSGCVSKKIVRVEEGKFLYTETRGKLVETMPHG